MTQAFNLSQFANKLNSSGQTDNTGLQNSSVTVTAGTGMSGGGAVALGSSVTLTNAGVTSVVAGTGISVSGATGAVTVTATGGGPPGILGQAFTSNGTFTIPTGITALKVTVIGAGGGGGRSGNGGGSSGGGGGSAIAFLTGLTPAATLAVTIGSGGAANNANNNQASTGGSSTVASGTQSITTITGAGGTGGYGDAYDGGVGGTATNGTLNIKGAGGNRPKGGGATILGMGTLAGLTAQLYGSGGGGGGPCSADNATAGAAGVVLFEW
jgi:hypothetical protein